MNHISDQELIDILLPSVPITTLGALCQSNSRLRQICQEDRLWHNKVIYDYPQWVNNKDEKMTWQDWYRFLAMSNYVPIYINGEVKGSIFLNSNNYQRVVGDLYDEVIPEKQEIFMIAMVDGGFRPLFIFKYPSTQPFIHNNGQIKDVKKIVVMNHDYIRSSDPVEITPLDVFIEATSNDQLYGIITIDGKFINSQDLGEFIDENTYNLINDLHLLQIYPPNYQDIPIPNHETMVGYLQRHDINPFGYFPMDNETITFYYFWLISGINREEIVKLIYDKLVETNRLHYLTGPLSEISPDEEE